MAGYLKRERWADGAGLQPGGRGSPTGSTLPSPEGGVNRAVREFNMIRDGDRIAVAVSGGKDSLALLRLLQVRRSFSHTQYELAAVHVLGDATGVTPPYPPLEAWLQTEGVPYRIAEQEVDPEVTYSLDCRRCAWFKALRSFSPLRS